ncbi:MAG: hypothetical protein ACRDSN_02940 [Pseudonocardiaceae bacterium]
MTKRASSGPVYRVLRKDSITHPTCVAAGQDQRNAWLYVHAPTPTVLRLHPPVVEFLQDVLAEVAALPDSAVAGLCPIYRSLRKGSTLSYPQCVVAGRSHRDIWLYVFAATPSAIKLVPRLVEFLQEALADLPAAPAPLIAVPSHLGLPIVQRPGT